jgi:hypothetical protein
MPEMDETCGFRRRSCASPVVSLDEAASSYAAGLSREISTYAIPAIPAIAAISQTARAFRPYLVD